MALHSFKTHIKDGKIHVSAHPAHTLRAHMAREPKVLTSGVASSGTGVVIVGGGSGAFQAVESLREVKIPAY